MCKLDWLHGRDSGRGRPLEEGRQPGSDDACVEVAMEPFLRGSRCFHANRFALKQVNEHGSRLGRVIQGPEPALHTIIEHLGYASHPACHNRKTSRHRLNDRQAERLGARRVSVDPVARQETTHISLETAEADLFLQTQGPRLPQELLPRWPVTKHIQREGSPGPPRLGKNLQQETLVLYDVKASNSDKIAE